MGLETNGFSVMLVALKNSIGTMKIFDGSTELGSKDASSSFGYNVGANPITLESNIVFEGLDTGDTVTRITVNSGSTAEPELVSFDIDSGDQETFTGPGTFTVSTFTITLANA